MPLSAFTVESADILPADGTSSQVLTTGNGVKTGHIQNLAVTGAKIAARTITTVNIGTSQITNALLTPNAVTTDKIQDGAVGTADLANGAVTDAKITGPISASKISSAGLNADTVDNMHASAFAPATHSHAQADVTGLAASLAGKSDVTHAHKYGKVAIVAQSGGDYIDPVNAMSNSDQWCGTPSASNPCLLKIMPGVYDLGTSSLLMKEHVDVEGSGENVTTISSSVTTFNGTVNGAGNSELRLLSVVNTTPGIGIMSNQVTAFSISRVASKAAGYAVYNYYSDVAMSDVTATGSGDQSLYPHGVMNSRSYVTMADVIAVGIAAPGGENGTGVWNYGGHQVMTNVTASGSGGGNQNYGVRNTYCSPVMTNVDASATGTSAYNQGVSFYAPGTAVMTNVAATASGGSTNYAISIYDGTVRMSSVKAAAEGVANTYGLKIEGGGGKILIDRSTVEGTTNSIFGLAGPALRIGASKLVGGISVLGGISCVGSYDGDYAPLDSFCK